MKNIHNNKIVYFMTGTLGSYHISRYIKMLEYYPNSKIINIIWEGYLRPWGNDLGILQDKTITIEIKEKAFIYEQSHKLLSFLNNYKPDALIVCGYDKIMIAVSRWAKQNHIPCILHADTWQGNRRRYWLKEIIKKYLIIKKYYDGAFVPGILGQQYFHSLGLSNDVIWRGMDVVDNNHFARMSLNFKEKDDVFRKELGLPKNYFLTVGSFIPEKNFPRLFQAFEKYQKSSGTWSLVVIGSGPLEKQLKSIAEKIPSLLFIDWQNYQELPIYYALARCFILPSISEAWGLVVNEAMACGLPILVSRNCGCLPELCHRGINGFDFDPFDVDNLSHLLLKISSGEINLNVMGAKSQKIIANHSLETWGYALRDCIETTIRRLNFRSNYEV